MITSRLMLSTMLLGSLALPALAQTHAVAPRVSNLHHCTVRPHRVAATASAVPDARGPLVAAAPASPVAGPVAGTASMMSHLAVGTTPVAPMSAPRVGTAVPGAKVN